MKIIAVLTRNVRHKIPDISTGNRSKILAVLWAALLTSSCTLVSSKNVGRTYYLLDIPSCEQAQHSRHLPYKLLLRETTAPQFINGQRIVFNREANSRDWYKLTAWAVPPPTRFSALLLQRLECENLLESVTLRSSTTLADLSLQADMIDFRHDLTQQPSKIIVSIRMELVDLSARRIKASRLFVQHIDSNETDIKSMIEAFNAGVQLVLDDTIKWLKDELEEVR